MVWQADKFPSLVRRDFKTIYPHGQQYIDLVAKQWWTRETVKTDAAGMASLRGFIGDYEITITTDGKVTTANAKLPKEGATVVVSTGN
ncbi:MAG TPA: hypothetical protein VK324_07605 [Tepidisphaeraceae bacterium]|nr:hypothetical protein [Tepidisphaeraceae bacterium]